MQSYILSSNRWLSSFFFFNTEEFFHRKNWWKRRKQEIHSVHSHLLRASKGVEMKSFLWNFHSHLKKKMHENRLKKRKRNILFQIFVFFHFQERKENERQRELERNFNFVFFLKHNWIKWAFCECEKHAF